jgi:hypothetical protein
VIELAFSGGLTHDQIATLTGVPSAQSRDAFASGCVASAATCRISLPSHLRPSPVTYQQPE